VEWAIAVSPYSDLAITKTAEITQVLPGERITYTLEYANLGLAAVDNVVITDALPLDRLTNITYVSQPPLAATPGYTYAWTVGRLSYGQSGSSPSPACSAIRPGGHFRQHSHHRRCGG